MQGDRYGLLCDLPDVCLKQGSGVFLYGKGLTFVGCKLGSYVYEVWVRCIIARFKGVNCLVALRHEHDVVRKDSGHEAHVVDVSGPS